MRYSLLAALACSSAAPPLSSVAPSAPPTGPAPAVQWAQRDITTTGLPAISSDGSAVVIAHRDNDGGRGNPNLTLIEKDRSDRVVRQHVVLHPNDLDYVQDAEIAQRVERANVWLREVHGARNLVGMTALSLDEPAGGPPLQARGGGVTLRWAPNRLEIERSGQAPIVRTTPSSWLAPDRPMCNGCPEVCHNDAFLGGGHVDLARSLAIVLVAYHGNDTCWEPSSQHHVVVW